MSNYQFYPTPSTLAYKAKSKFKNKKITRLLEPSAGRADLLAPFLNDQYNKPKIDCIELDFNNQAVLRGKKLNVIDADFMQFDGAALYSHILMNPPFAQGAEHVIKAFNLLVSGEIVAIVNAETVKNPYTSNRKLLVKWIEMYGDVEYIEQAFMEPDTLKKTTVEIALIHLEKVVDLKQNFTQNLETEKLPGIDDESKQELAIKSNTISNAVIMFNTAVAALKTYELANEEYLHYSKLLGRPLNQMNEPLAVEMADLQTRYNNGYDDLKKRAWTNILHSTEFSKYLSSGAYKQLVADFEAVSALSFTESNIRGFLLGLVNSQGEMNLQMVLDTFDEIAKYRPENRAYYRGWKSNQKHKEQAFRVQMTRFVIPSYGSSWSNSMSPGTLQKLRDFDKTFAMLDGKAESENSLYRLFDKNMSSLKGGARVSTDYFDVRWYAGVGTIHFFPTNKKVIERLNLLVGKERQWLPEDDKQASKAFWDQYNRAEQVTKKMVIPEKIGYHKITDEQLMEAHLVACDKLGFDTSNMLSYDEKEAA